jgi:hypothetical protein
MVNYLLVTGSLSGYIMSPGVPVDCFKLSVVTIMSDFKTRLRYKSVLNTFRILVVEIMAFISCAQKRNSG